MPPHSDLPGDSYAILNPAIRWYPGDAVLAEMGYEMLLPPLVHRVRQGVKAWRDGGIIRKQLSGGKKSMLLASNTGRDRVNMSGVRLGAKLQTLWDDASRI